MRNCLPFILLSLALLFSSPHTIPARQPANGAVASEEQVATKTQIVLLGTGTPTADPDRSGPSVAIVVNDTPYIVDFGPGVVRRAAAAFRSGVKGLAMPKLT